jgi:hypothetical protein
MSASTSVSATSAANDMVLLMSARRVEWNGAKSRKALDLLQGEGKMIVTPTILPWKETARHHIPDDGSESMMMDRRGTSCFVIKFGVPSELIARELWDEHGKIAFASPRYRSDYATAIKNLS